MYTPIIVHADAGLDLYRELSRPVDVPQGQVILRGELSEITQVIIRPSPECAVLINVENGRAIQLPISEGGTVTVPSGDWQLHYLSNGSSQSTRLTISGCDVSMKLKKQVPTNRVNTPWYQQFDKRRALAKPKR